MDMVVEALRHERRPKPARLRDGAVRRATEAAASQMCRKVLKQSYVSTQHCAATQ